MPGLGILLVRPAQCPEIGGEAIQFKTVKVHPERFDIAHASETGLLALRGELVTVVRYIPQEFQLVLAVDLIAKQGLKIGKRGFVLACFVQAFEHPLGITLAEPNQIGEFLILGSPFQMKMPAHEVDAERSGETGRCLVLDIQYRRHLVPVFGIEAAAGECQILYQVGIDEAQAFLLSGTGQERPVDFDSVHVDKVFIEIPSSDRILGTQLVVVVHARQGCQQTFHAPGDAGQALDL